MWKRTRVELESVVAAFYLYRRAGRGMGPMISEASTRGRMLEVVAPQEERWRRLSISRSEALLVEMSGAL